MKKALGKQFFLAHAIMVALIAVIVVVPNQKNILVSYYPLLVGIGVIEVLYLVSLARRVRSGRRTTGPNDIITLVWVLMLLWELFSTKWAMTPNVLVPTPEEVFSIFYTARETLVNNVISSVSLLAVGYTLGMVLGIALGIVCGWIPRLREMFYPIANVMAPIPPTVFAPYLVVLMPTFRMASACVIILGVFWPQFLNMVLRVSSLDQELLDNARALGVRNWTMITRIILPYVTPNILQSLRVSLTTAFIMLTFAEMIGAKAGIGFYITNSSIYANYAAIIAGIIVCGVVVTVLSSITQWAQRRFMTWR